MGCPITPLSCLTPSAIFAGVYSPSCGGFADPSNFQAERAIFNSGFSELINNFGVEINYYVDGFNLSAANILYGEDPTQIFSDPFIIKAYLELTEGISLSRFGYDASDELTIYLSIDNFSSILSTYLTMTDTHNLSALGLRLEPKSGDLIEVTSLGCDRPGGRGSKIYQVTEALDQDAAGGLNPMTGHYIWRLKATRYDHTYETNAPKEKKSDQVYDNTFSGKLSSVLFPNLSTDAKVYPFDIDTISKNDVYNQDNVNNDIYGTYY